MKYFVVVCSNTDLVSQVAKLRLDLAALDRQLLDAVSQKLLLSQQLEAWQVHIYFHLFDIYAHFVKFILHY